MKIEKDILEKIMTEIAICNYKEEMEMMRKSNIEEKKYFQKIAIFFCIFIGISTISVLASMTFKRIENRNKVYSTGTIKKAEESGYIQNVDMDYIYSKDIGVKINSIILSDNDLDLVIDFNFEHKQLTRNSIVINCIVYDEDNNIYGYSDHSIYKRGNKLIEFLETMNINYDKEKPYETVYSKSKVQNNLVETENELMAQISFHSEKLFPKNKKIFVKIFDIGYIENNQYKSISNKSEWTIEIPLIDEFYNRKSEEYILATENKDFRVEKAYITETSMTLIYTINNNNLGIDKVDIIDEKNNRYSPVGEIYRNGDRIINQFSINRDTITQKLYVEVLINQEIKRLELIKK